MRQRHVGRVCQDRTFRRHAFKTKIIASSHLRCQLLSRSSRAGQVIRWFSTLSPGMRFPSKYSHSVLEPLGRTMPSPSARNATAKRGHERRPPVACNRPPDAGIPTHAFANSPIRTQRISMRHRVPDRCTASRVLSVAYATEKSRENTGPAHPRDDGILSTGALSPIGLLAAFLRWNILGRYWPRFARYCSASKCRCSGRLFEIVLNLQTYIESALRSVLGAPSKLFRQRLPPYSLIWSKCGPSQQKSRR